MDKQAFKQRMQDLKSYRENNPGKGYWDWKVEAFAEGGVNDNLVGSYSNHTGTPTMYLPVTKEYEATPEGFGEIANVHTPEVTITPQNNISLAEAVDKGRRDAAPYVGAIMAGAALPAMASTGGLGTAMDLAGIITDPLDPLNYLDKFKLLKALKINNRDVNKISQRFRNSEWSNFLSTENGDAYYRMSRGNELSNRNLDENLFVSHTTPWEEFSGLGSSDPHGIKTLYKFPTEVFGIRKASNHKGIIGEFDVTDLGKKHLLYGNTSSGIRDKVQLLSEKTANMLDMDAYTIGVKDRPKLRNGYYDTSPEYEDIYLGNQTVIQKKELRDALLNSTYTKFDFDPNQGITKTLHIGSYAKGGEYETGGQTGDSNNEVGDKYDFPWYVPIPDRVNGTELMIRDTIWSDKADPSKYIEYKIPREAEGGEIGDPEKERFYQATGRSSSGRPLEEGLKPVFSLEDAANMTPIGDAISARDTYNAVKNRDWLGAGLAAVTMIPFVPTTVRNFRKKYKGITPKREIPTVNKKAIDNAIDEAKNYRDGRIKLYQQAIEDRNASYERLIENEDALRRAANFDKKYGTNYVKTYTKQLQNYAKSKNSPDLMQIGIKPMSANGSFDPNIPDYVFINSDYVKNGKLQPGLISHEKSHYDNQKAGALSLPIFDNRFVDTKKTKTMYPKTYDWIQRYLHNFEETKSHMNEFRTNMINKNLLKPDSKVGLKQIKDLIFNSDNDNIKKLFNTYKSKRQFVKDFNSVPITSIGDNKTLV